MLGLHFLVVLSIVCIIIYIISRSFSEGVIDWLIIDV